MIGRDLRPVLSLSIPLPPPLQLKGLLVNDIRIILVLIRRNPHLSSVSYIMYNTRQTYLFESTQSRQDTSSNPSRILTHQLVTLELVGKNLLYVQEEHRSLISHLSMLVS